MKTSALMKERYALITGGSRGIGLAAAGCLAGAGCNVALASRNLDACREAARRLADDCAVETLGARCDVTDRESVRSLFRELNGWSGGRLDVLVCNAGYPFVPDIWDTPLHASPPAEIESRYLEIFRTDALGSVFCTREALPLMMTRRRGSIIYVSSTPALAGFKGVPYTMAKAALLGLVKDMALEYGPHNIRANALALGNIRTPATFDRLDPGRQKEAAAEAPLGRWGLPEEAAQAVLYLASDQSSFVTGQTLVVDGGVVRR